MPHHESDPSTNADFWQKKIVWNQHRDNAVTKHLEDLGWRVLRIWEHDIKDHLDEVVEFVTRTVCAGP